MNTTTTQTVRKVVKAVQKPVAKVVSKPDPTALIEAKLRDLASISKVIALNQEKDKALRTELFNLMTESDIKDYNTPEAYVEITRSMGRATNTILPGELRKVVTDEDFLSLVTVGLGKVKESHLLTEREIAGITVTTPGKLGDPALVIKFK